MGAATDARLRAAARRLAGRVVLDLSRRELPRGRGVGRLRSVPADRGGDLDLDASLPAIAEGRAARRPPRVEELRARAWGRPEIALCLLVDASGSMGGVRLATAALTAAACALRAPGACAVVAFARDVEVLRPLDSEQPTGAVVDRVLGLRGHGTTALASALDAAAAQLAGSAAARRVVVLLSDARHTDDVDPIPAARRLADLRVLAPADDCEQAAAFARTAGARWTTMTGPSDAPPALARLLADDAELV